MSIWGILTHSHPLPVSVSVINVMVDPDGTLDALASLGLASPTTPTQPQTSRTAPSATSPGSAPAAKQALPEILPGPGGSTARAQPPSPSREEVTVRDLGVGLGLTGGLSFSRMRPSGEEAIAQKWTHFPESGFEWAGGGAVLTATQNHLKGVLWLKVLLC